MWGGLLDALNKTPSKRVFKADPKNPVATIQEEVEEEVFEMPSINELDVDINAPLDHLALRLLKIWPVPNGGRTWRWYIREADPTYSKESFAEDFMRDAGSSRNHEQAQET